MQRLDYLAELGITAIELMPVADFPGARNWGYDGVLQYAPDARYGTPDELKALVQAAHARGLMVLLDVVYNHFGPDGNYLHVYAPPFFSQRHHTPWGAAINFDDSGSRTVRDFFIHNALYWLEEYHFDGLRLDAVHAILDDSRPDIIEELAAVVHAGPGRSREVHLVLENDANEARYIGQGSIAAQWNDDIHHALHILLTGERDGYYADYADQPVRHLARCLAEGFAFQGEPSAFRDGCLRGEPSNHLPPGAFVNFTQTHDQVGNRAYGERLAMLAQPAPLRARSLWCCWRHRRRCCSWARSLRRQRRSSSSAIFRANWRLPLPQGDAANSPDSAKFADPGAQARIPDPNDPATFERSKLTGRVWTSRRIASGLRFTASC
jgi:maltooligosyl trehalose hydrolase (EC 3.2.1.141)